MITVLKRLQFFVALLISSGLFAQQTISGSVTDDTGAPLPGATVVVQGTDRGVTSDFDGNFTLTVNQGEVLEASYIGYQIATQTVMGDAPITFVLQPDNELEEVVLTGYGTARRTDLTGTIDVISEKDFTRGSVMSPQQLIQGKIAGVSIVSNSGAPGEGSNILIRGIGSLNLNNNPLFVVDGIPLDGGGISGSRNPLNAINPNDIASMTVLKDASATAIYGSRAANGVVLITTKRGTDQELSFDFSTRSSLFTPVNKVNVLTASEFITAVNETGNADAIALLGTATTDWQDEIYSNAFANDTSLSVAGSLAGFPFRASVGYTNQDGILLGDNFERMTSSLNFSPEFLDGDLRVNLNARFVYTENDFADRGAIGSAVSFDPTKPVYDENSPYENYYTWLDDNGVKLGLSPTNPLALLELKDDESIVNRVIANAMIAYDLPIDGLTATVNVGLDESTGRGFSATDSRIPTEAVGFNGSYNDYNNDTTNLLFDAYLNYDTSFGGSSIKATLGHSYQSFEYDNMSYNTVEYLNEDGTVNTTSSIAQNFIDKSKNTLLSYFGRLNYNLNDKLLITGTLRADASSKLPSEDRWGVFFSTAVAYNLHKEFGLDTVFDELKIRVGYGEIGNVNGLGDYNFLTRYTQSDIRAQYTLGSQLYRTFRPSAINKDLRWEVGETYNAGLDFRIAKVGLSGTVNAYIKNTNDLIATAIVDPFTNFASTISANIGDMENKGIEVELNYDVIDTDDFGFSLSYNAAINDNTITRLENPQNVGDLGLGNKLQRHEVGKSPYAYYVYKQIYAQDGSPIEGAYADLNGDGIINNDDRYFYKDPYADVIMGLTANVRYGNFDAQVVSRASIGNYSYNRMASGSTQYGITDLGRLTNVHNDYLSTGFLFRSDRNNVSDHFIQNASFFRIDNVTLGYTIENAINNNPLRVYVTGDNLFVATNYDGIDPEITGGIDDNFYPRSRVVALGVDFKF